MDLKISILYLFISTLFFLSLGRACAYEQKEVVSQTMDKLGQGRVANNQDIAQGPYMSGLFSRRRAIIDRTLDDIEIKISFKIGYMTGDTTYDFDHHTSELMFPFDNWMAGAEIGIKSGKFSFALDGWGSLGDSVGDKMTDKDWGGDVLISSTESQAKIDAVIWGASLRYDFYERSLNKNVDLLTLRRADKIRLGALLGYRYERFDFDLFDLYYPVLGITTNAGQKVGTYKIEYSLPYIGLAGDVSRKNYGLNANIKFAVFPTAKDVDNHLLRELTFYGDYDKPRRAWMYGASAFWKPDDRWKISLGLQGEFILIDGITWEEQRDPAWDKDQETDLQQLIVWTGLQYKF
ncbi:MAG: omptin family outer membrane protease [Candidatus Omnitrophota bacterium]